MAALCDLKSNDDRKPEGQVNGDSEQDMTVEA